MLLPESKVAALQKMQGLHSKIKQAEKLLWVKIFYHHQNKTRN